MNEAAVTAFARFGLGRGHGEPTPPNTRAWLAAQLEVPDPTPPGPTTAEGLALVAAVQQEQRANRQPSTGLPDTPETDDAPRRALREHVRQEAANLLGNALTTQAPFRERLVWFWTNHFTIAARTRPAAATAGAYVREAIRPNVTGSFADMLLAVMRHPAILSYLDQAGSVGPSSPAGQRQHRGLNENLARECLELHTITPAAGYTQADVTAFARLLTGYSLQVQPPAGFLYRPRAHEPGPETLLGRTWPDAESALRFLADHPATHRHLAEKLARHFVADDPLREHVAAIEATLTTTNGDLGAAAHALIDLPAAWIPLTKLRTPQDFAIAALRACGTTADQVPHLPGVVAQLGQPLFGAPFPIGWPDRAADWSGPEAMLARIDFAYALAGRAQSLDAAAIADEQLGPLAGADLRREIARAGSRQEALTLLFASPEFQRR